MNLRDPRFGLVRIAGIFQAFGLLLVIHIVQKAGNTPSKLLKCKFSKKLKFLRGLGGFKGLLRKKLTLFNKNYICILRKNLIFGKIETPAPKKKFG